MQKEKKKAIYKWGLAAGVVLIFLIWQQREKVQTVMQKEESFTVETVAVKPQKFTLSKKYIGYIIPINQVDVVPFINGYVEKISAESGKQINQGEELLRIRPEEYAAKRETAAAMLTKAEAEFVNAKTYYDRILKAGEKAVSKTEIDNAQAAFLEAQAGLAGAKADLNFAEINLGYTVLFAPISGQNGYIDLSIGDYISPGKALFSIIQYDPIRVVFSISDKDYLEKKHSDKMFENDIIKLKLADDTIYEYAGKFAFADNKTDKATGSIAIYADFPNPQKFLSANSYVDVIIENELQDVVLVDKRILLMQPGGNFLYMARQDTAILQKVEILGEAESKYILADNFTAGDRLIVSNLQSLRPNMKIKTEEKE